MAESPEQGGMDISEHRRTWNGFVQVTKWGTISVAILLILMAIFLL